MTRLTKVGAALAALACVGPALTVRAGTPSGRYTTSGGTVLDSKTKLVWQKASSSSMMNWTDAKTYCAGLGSTLGGTGWRLPTIKELLTLVDLSTSTIDTTYFPTTSGGYWSVTPVTGSLPPSAWLLYFQGGQQFQSAPSNSYWARCVR